MKKVYLNGIHKIEAYEIDERTEKVIFLEKMGERFVKLGPSEIWEKSLRQEITNGKEWKRVQ